jgi:hypothetical protein
MKSNKNRHLLIVVICILLVGLPLGTVFAQGVPEAQGGVFGAFEVQPRSIIEVPVEIREVKDLYAVDLELHFDPAVVQVQDADPDIEGIQPALGMFLDAGLMLFNTVDNEAGLVRFVMTQVNPSEAKSGSGVVLVLYLQGVADGTSDLTVTVLELATRGGEAIPVGTVNGSITVTDTASELESTSIPVQDQNLMVAIPTMLPTSAPTEEAIGEEELAQSTPAEQMDSGTKEENGEEQPAATPTEIENTSNTSGCSLLEYWWVVLIIVVIVVGFGVYLWVSRK